MRRYGRRGSDACHCRVHPPNGSRSARSVLGHRRESICGGGPVQITIRSISSTVTVSAVRS